MTTLSNVLEDALEHALGSLHVGMPAKIVRYDPDLQACDVQPLLHYTKKSGESTMLPQICMVPVVFPRSQTAWFKFPLKKDDLVWLTFSDRSLDKWLQGGQAAWASVDPQDPRHHALIDAVAIPGCYPWSHPIKDENHDDIVIGFDDGAATQSSIRIRPNGDIVLDSGRAGRIAIGNEQTELLSLLEYLIDKLIQAKVVTSMGAQPFVAETIYNLMYAKTRLQRLKGSL